MGVTSAWAEMASGAQAVLHGRRIIVAWLALEGFLRMGTVVWDGVATAFASVTPVRNGETRCRTAQEKTFDDLLLEVARRVPSFGGMYSDPDGHLFVYLVDPDAREAAQAALIEVFGQDLVPAEGIRVVLGQYRFLDLKIWHDRLTGPVLRMPGVVLTDVDEARNRVLIGTVTGKPPARFAALLKKLSVPPGAIIFEKVEPVHPLPRRRSPGRRVP